MASDAYNEYMRSKRWQELRAQRLKIDNYKCQKCGRPFDLQVHHLFYPTELGTEDPYRDLITLCDFCHEEVTEGQEEYRVSRYAEMEKQRKEQEDEWLRQCEERAEEARRRQEAIERAKKLVKEFIENVRYADLSANGPEVGIDYCNLDVIKSELYPFLRENGAPLTGVSDVQRYFRNRRYERILKMMDEGYTEKEIRQETGFSPAMIKKVFEKPYIAKATLKNEKEDYTND